LGSIEIGDVGGGTTEILMDGQIEQMVRNAM